MEAGRADLSSLPDELIVHIGHCALSVSLPAVLRMEQTCQRFRGVLQPVRAAASELRLQWMPGASISTEISNHGCTIATNDGASLHVEPWGVGNLLPTAGRSAWSVRVEQSHWNQGDIVIGVCDKDGICGWGVWLFRGRLVRESRGHDNVVLAGTTVSCSRS